MLPFRIVHYQLNFVDHFESKYQHNHGAGQKSLPLQPFQVETLLLEQETHILNQKRSLPSLFESVPLQLPLIAATLEKYCFFYVKLNGQSQVD